MKQTIKVICVIAAAIFVFAAIAACTGKNAELTGAGEDASAWDMIRLMLPSEKNTVAVTADGELSDFLLPIENSQPQQEDKTGDYTISGSPNILIYHTHTTEAYRQVGGDEYDESGSWRTHNNDKNIVAVGEVMKKELEAQGFNVIHDTTDHEPPKLTTAYDRSVVTMEKYLKKYPDIDIFIDLHRDATSSESTEDYVNVDGKKCARMMFVVGRGEGFEKKPNFKRNYSFAKSINAQLVKVDDALVRNICIKKGRYNQHVGDLNCLIEIGHNMNTLEEAENSAVIFARALSKVVSVEK